MGDVIEFRQKGNKEDERHVECGELSIGEMESVKLGKTIPVVIIESDELALCFPLIDKDTLEDVIGVLNSELEKMRRAN